jgi:peptidoglycan/LPS O-acetylase OafA/YrhL
MIGKRIEYIDALRGFTMYLVVYSHIWTYGYHAKEEDGFTTLQGTLNAIVN